MSHRPNRTDRSLETSDAVVVDSREINTPEADQITHVTVEYGDDQYALAFTEGDDIPRLVTSEGDREIPNDVITTAYRHLSDDCVTVDTVTESDALLDDRAYYYGGGGDIHIFDGSDTDSMCNRVQMEAGRLRLGGFSKPLSQVDDLCPKCVRELKLAGDYEAYERPKHV